MGRVSWSSPWSTPRATNGAWRAWCITSARSDRRGQVKKYPSENVKAPTGGVQMSGRSLLFVGVVNLVGLALLVPGSSAGQTAGKPDAKQSAGKPLRTSWGDPDLSGRWSNSTIVPLERPDDLKGREFLSEQETKARFENHRKFLFAKREGDTGFYNEFWWEWGKDTNRTSLIVDPPDGKLSFTPQAQEAAKKRRLAQMV